MRICINSKESVIQVCGNLICGKWFVWNNIINLLEINVSYVVEIYY